jgi:hypothetical protein
LLAIYFHSLYQDNPCHSPSRPTVHIAPPSGEGVCVLLWVLFTILLVLWLLGWGYGVGGSLIHVLLVIAAFLLVLSLVRSGHTAQ